ncbi:PE family protein, partial [Mycobacterium kansasii]
EFVRALTAGAGAYAGADAGNATPLSGLLNLINAPTQTLLARPLIGDGADGLPGQPGAPGGLLYGNGGNGGAGLPGMAGGHGG